MVDVKILGLKKPQRYAVQRAVLAAQNELNQEFPDLEVRITEVKTSMEVQQYTAVTVYPSLVVNEGLVCVGRFPRKEEVIRWLGEALRPCR